MHCPLFQFDCSFRYPSGFELSLAFSSDAPVTAIVGPSGCGKTTVLNLITGLLVPDRGSISLENRCLFDSERRINVLPEERRIGYVFQDYQLFPHMTVDRNLRYGERRNGTAEIPFAKVIEVLKLSSILHQMPVTLSGGQKQRVALGRAILSSPKLLLLDEPLSAIDAEHRREVVDFLSQAIAEFSIPTLLVSHDRESIDRLTNEFVHIQSK